MKTVSFRPQSSFTNEAGYAPTKTSEIFAPFDEINASGLWAVSSSTATATVATHDYATMTLEAAQLTSAAGTSSFAVSSSVNKVNWTPVTTVTVTGVSSSIATISTRQGWTKFDLTNTNAGTGSLYVMASV